MQPSKQQKTSVFSEYENNENDSISSRQLQFWLKQTAPIVQPKLGNQWTLMSANSIFEQDEHPLMRNQTFESLQKQNDSLAFNSNRQTCSNASSILKSKSYVNAMVDLQNKIKKLQKENENLRTSVKAMRQVKDKQLSQSSCLTEELKNRIQSLEPKAKKIEQLVRQNKKLRDWKQENIKRLKGYEKLQKEAQLRQIQSKSGLLALREEKQSKQSLLKQATDRNKELEQQVARLKQEKLKLQQKCKRSDDLKDKSTTSILEKLSNFIRQNQLMASQNNQLRDELRDTVANYELRLKEISEKNSAEREEYMGKYHTAAQQIKEKKEVINILTEENKYFKQGYERISQELIESLKKHSEDLKDVRVKESQVYEQRSRTNRSIQRKKAVQQPVRQTIQIISHSIEERYGQPRENHEEKDLVMEGSRQRDIDINKVSFIRQNPRQPIQSQYQYQQFNQQTEQQIQEELELDRPAFQTRSAVDKSKSFKGSNKRKRLENRSDHRSHQLKETFGPTLQSEQTNSKIKGLKGSLMKSKEKSAERHGYKQGRSSNEKMRQNGSGNVKEKSMFTSQHKNKDGRRQKEKESNEKSGRQRDNYLMVRSYEPLTHQDDPDFPYESEEQGNNTTHHRKNIPYYWDTNQIAQFSLSQKRNQTLTNRNMPLNGNRSLQKMLLNQLSLEAVRLLEEQEKIINSNSEAMSVTERAQIYGRLKQLNQQIKVNNEKLIETKQKLNGN